MEAEFTPDERLYRGVLDNSIFWKANRTLSTTIFKNHPKDAGISVDRQQGRSEPEAMKFALNHLTGSIIYILVSHCVECGTLVKHCPREDNGFFNQYHSEIHRSTDVTKLSPSQSNYLTSKAEIVHYSCTLYN
ncbi:hypothetical protein [Sporobacter termitidis]|uniref:hypothetical protein n=1 Tax=Sporobacter termitidis TaxID=44749 RepID=UPI0011601217|nr:hypothetical protein [Sporobacter termitidis]